MAEGTVVKEYLPPGMIEEGGKVTEHLINARLGITASLWLYSLDHNAWRLMIGMPKVKIDGPRQAYAQIQTVLTDFYSPSVTITSPSEPVKLGTFQPRLYLSDIHVVDSKDPFLKTLRKKLGPGIHNAQYSSLWIGDYYVEGAFIYWLK